MKKLSISNSLKNITKISLGTIIGQSIAIVSLPFLTRIYGSEIIGIWATITAISNIVNTVSDFGLMQVVMLEDDDKIENTYSVVSVLIIFVSMLAAIFTFLYCRLGIQYSIKLSLTVMFFTVLYASTLQQVQLNYILLSRNKNYSILVKNPIINQLTAAITSLVLGVVGMKEYGYFIGITFGQLLTLFHMRRSVSYRVKWIGCRKIRETIVQHSNFVRFQMPVNIAVVSREQLPNLLIGAFFGDSVLGYYSISQKLLNIPITFIGQSMGVVFYQRCAEMKRKNQDIAEFFYRNMKRALKVAIIPMIMLATYGDAAILLFFGTEYSIGGIIVRIIVFRAFFSFVSTATRSIDIILDKQQYAMITCITQTIMMSLSIIISKVVFDNIIISVIMMTVFFIIIQIGYFCVMYRVMKIPVMQYLKDIIIAIFLIVVLTTILRWGLCI